MSYFMYAFRQGGGYCGFVVLYCIKSGTGVLVEHAFAGVDLEWLAAGLLS